MRLAYIILLITTLSSLEAKNTSKHNVTKKPHLFPKESCYLYELKAKAKQLKANRCKGAAALIDEINRRVQSDKKIQSLSIKHAKKHIKLAGRFNHPFDKNRTGRHLKGVYINASDVRMKRQHYVLAACPKTHEQTRDYFEAALAQKVVVFVSALKSNEARRHYNNFWKKDKIRKIILRDGSRIKHIASHVLNIKKKSKQKSTPEIIETQLRISKGKKITHLHYDGWQDQRAMPCEKLLNLLLDRIYELSPNPAVPVAINCRGGAGRTGTVAVSLYLRREVDAQRALGVTLDKIKVNIPEVIYSFRNQRKSIVGTPAQLAQIYSVLADYYKRCVKEAI